MKVTTPKKWCVKEAHKHAKRAAGGYLFGCGAYEAARVLFELVPGGLALKVLAVLAFGLALDEEAMKATAEVTETGHVVVASKEA